MWLYIGIGSIVIIFIVRYYLNEKRRKAEELEAERQRARLQEVTRNLRLNRPASSSGAGTSNGKTGPKILFCFGSQTGTAEEFAETLSGESQDYGFQGTVVDLEDLEPEDLAGKTAVFLMATYGEGEPTDNAKQFVDWLTADERTPDEIEGLRYSVFALGNRSYDHFCKMGKVVHGRLGELGAVSLYPLGEGDDLCSLEEDFDKWKRGLWAPLCAAFNLPLPASHGATKHRRRSKMLILGETLQSSSIRPAQLLEHWIKPHGPSSSSSSTTTSTSSAFGVPPDHKTPFAAKLVRNEELHTAKSDRSCRHLELQVAGGLRYEAGDHLGVYPENDPQLVEHLLQRLGCAGPAAERVVSFVNLSDNKTFLGPSTLRRIFTSYCEISAPPRRSVFAGLVEHAADPAERERLRRLGDPSSEEGTHDYAALIKHDYRSIGEILDLFPSVAIPVDQLVELLPRLAARFYSISSSPKHDPSVISLTAVVTRFTSPAGRLVNGVCSSWLQQRGPSSLVPCFVRTSEFRLPRDPATGVIMIGPGTGFAPFRGFLQERKATGATGKAVLFFGCRTRDIDHIYADEMRQFVADGTISALHLAYSRETDQKVYVQHKLQEVAAEIWEMISQGAHIYVCGDGKAMSEDVRKALTAMAVSHGYHSPQSAEAFLADLQKKKIYQQDVW